MLYHLSYTGKLFIFILDILTNVSVHFFWYIESQGVSVLFWTPLTYIVRKKNKKQKTKNVILEINAQL